MATHVSAKKRAIRNAKRAVLNKSKTSRLRGYLKKVEQAIAAGDRKEAQEALKKAQPHIHKGVAKGLLHKNAAARKLSRLSAKIKAIKK
jgi:small subunit ribosomal protein S20